MAFQKGNIPWNLGMIGEYAVRYGAHLSDDTKQILSEKSKGNKNWLGKHPTAEHKDKLRIIHLGIKYTEETNKKKGHPGDKNPAWKGGVTPENEKARKSFKYQNWRLSVFERDNYICQDCNIRSGKGNIVYLEAHHIKSFKNYTELRFEINNGITLCKECHKNIRKKKIA